MKIIYRFIYYCSNFRVLRSLKVAKETKVVVHNNSDKMRHSRAFNFMTANTSIIPPSQIVIVAIFISFTNLNRCRYNNRHLIRLKNWNLYNLFFYATRIIVTMFFFLFFNCSLRVLYLAFVDPNSGELPNLYCFIFSACH